MIRQKRKVPAALVNAPAGHQSTLYWPMAGMYFESRATPALQATNATPSHQHDNGGQTAIPCQPARHQFSPLGIAGRPDQS